MMPIDPTPSPASDAIRPLKDVWLRPRRVFRELADKPLSFTDFVLASVLGMGNFLSFYRAQPVNGHAGISVVMINALEFGPICGIASMYLLANIYTRLGFRAGGTSSRAATFHVLAYGGVPVVAALAIWVLVTLLIGDTAFLAKPDTELDGFQAAILQVPIAANFFLWLWSVVLQVMGFSELLAITNAKAFGLYVLGLLLWMVALAMLLVLIAILFPTLLPIPST